ncbi:MAG: type II toxin-antitoxin system HicA family toxin, partial [Pseudomonadota bacterium]
MSAKRISSISGKELIKLLETAGWQIERVRGSHHIMRKA